MDWLFRRLIGPFVVGSMVCTALLLVWTVAAADTGATISLSEAALASFFILPFEAIGLLLLVPIALLLRDLSLPERIYPMLLAVIGAALGIVVVLPIIDMPNLLELALPAACGALSALVWFALNRDPVRHRPE